MILYSILFILSGRIHLSSGCRERLQELQINLFSYVPFYIYNLAFIVLKKMYFLLPFAITAYKTIHASTNPPQVPPLKKSKKHHHSSPTLDKMMERFLQQSVDAEEKFYKFEEQRLQIEEKRRESEHKREIQMLQMLGQMLNGIQASTSRMTTPAHVIGPHRGDNRTHGDTMHTNTTPSYSSPIGIRHPCHYSILSMPISNKVTVHTIAQCIFSEPDLAICMESAVRAEQDLRYYRNIFGFSSSNIGSILS